MDDQIERILTKDSLKAVAITLLLTGVGIGLLAWQYQRMEAERQPQLEREQQERLLQAEREEARTMLELFLDARVAGDERRALQYVTEPVQFQHQVGLLDLEESFLGYSIQDEVREVSGTWRFRVALEKEGFLPQVEIIRMLPLLGTYFVNSVERAG